MVSVPPVPLSSACSEHVPMYHMTQHHHGTELPGFGFRYLGFESESGLASAASTSEGCPVFWSLPR